MKAMHRGVAVVLAGFVIAAFCAGPAVAQQKAEALKRKLVGSWEFVSAVYTKSDGTVFEAFGGNMKGTMFIARNGRFAVELMGDSRRKFASDNRLKGTPEEYQGATWGTLAYFGTYSVGDSDPALTFHVVASTFPNQDGSDQKRSISFNKGELTWTSPSASGGGAAKVVWRKVK